VKLFASKTEGRGKHTQWSGLIAMSETIESTTRGGWSLGIIVMDCRTMTVSGYGTG